MKLITKLAISSVAIGGLFVGGNFLVQNALENSVVYATNQLVQGGTTAALTDAEAYLQEISEKNVADYYENEQVVYGNIPPFVASQGISLSNQLVLTKGELTFLSQRKIVSDTAHLQKTIEELLIMGDLHEGEITKEPLLISTLFTKLKTNYHPLRLNPRK